MLIVAEQMGVDELGLKRLFRLGMTEIERLGTPTEQKNLVDWQYYRGKWRGMTFPEREGVARLEILPLFLQPKKQQADIVEETPKEIRALILRSLGVEQ